MVQQNPESNARRRIGIGLGLLLAAHLALLGAFQITSVDTWWHLKEGQLYVATRSLPVQDPFAFTTQGREWSKYSWLADILFYLVYAAAGPAGLVWLRLCLLFLICLLLYKLLRGCGLHPLATLLLVFLASLALRFRLFIRPEILSFPLLLITLTILLRLKAAQPWSAYLLWPVQAVWTNVHSSFVFGFGLTGLVLLTNLLPAGWATPAWGRLRLDRGRLGHLALAFLGLPLVSLLNPQGLSMLLFPFRQNAMTRLTTFAEWAPAWILPRIDPAWWEVIIVLAIVILAFVVSSLLLLAREHRLDPMGWGILLSMGTYAIFRNRAIPYFILAILPLLGIALIRVLDAGAFEAVSRRLRFERMGAAACAVVLVASILDQGFLASRFPLGFGVRRDFFPEGAAAFLERHRLDGRLFNSYKFGGYLIWRRWPANQVFIDGRYDGVLFDPDLLESYLEAQRSPVALDRITRTYDVEILLLDADPGRRIMYLDSRPGWVRVYWDPVAEVFVRRGGRYDALAADSAYRLTHPATDMGYLALYRRTPVEWDRAIQELQRAVAANPENQLAWLGLAQEYRAAGPASADGRLEALTQLAHLLRGAAEAADLEGERAEVLLQLGRLDEAATAAQQGLQMDGPLLAPHWTLATIAERRGAWAEARDQLRAILTRLQPDHSEVPTIRMRLQGVEQHLGGSGAPARK